MSRIFTILSLTGSYAALAAVAPVVRHIALQYTTNNNVAARIIVNNTQGRHWQNVILSSSDETLLTATEPINVPAIIALPLVDNATKYVTVVVQSPIYVPVSEQAFLGIAPNSSLTQLSGAVALIKGVNSAQLVLRSTMDAFNASCDPATLFSLSNLTGGTEIRVNTKLVLGNGDIDFGYHKVKLRYWGNLISIPWVMNEKIDQILTEKGGSTIHPSLALGKYSNCVVSILDHLPIIEFKFTSSGSLVYHPEEYIEFDTSDNTCELLVYPSSYLDTIMLPVLGKSRTNVRITRDNEWSFCNSIATF